MAKKLHYAITYFFIGIVIAACLFFSGCNPSKKAARKAAKLERKAEKHLYKSISFDPMPFTIECAQKFNPIDSVHEISTSDTVIMPPVIKYVSVDLDSLINEYLKTLPATVDAKEYERVLKELGQLGKAKLPCPPCDSSKIIKTYKSKYQTESNKAAQDSLKNYYERIVGQLRDDLGKSQVSEARAKEQRNMWRIAALVLAGYTLLRWLLRYFTKGRINIP